MVKFDVQGCNDPCRFPKNQASRFHADKGEDRVTCENAHNRFNPFLFASSGINNSSVIDGDFAWDVDTVRGLVMKLLVSDDPGERVKGPPFR